MVRCSHGIQDGEPDFVQRYRYDVSRDRWNPTDYTAEGATYAPNETGAEPHPHVPPLFDDDDEPVRLSRGHFTARCKQCHQLVAMRADRAQIALTRLSDLGLTDVSLRVLQHAYDQVAQMLR